MTTPALGQLEHATARLTQALSELDLDALTGESRLPGWSRLTVACHLRYGARALHWMTQDSQAGRTTSYYPQGRAAQRDSTLRPDQGETPQDVVHSLATESTALHALWSQVDDWDIELHEPPEAAELGHLRLRQLASLRLTEVEVHSTDLNVGLGPWSDVFIRDALSMRLGWLPSRRENSESLTPNFERSWLFVRTDEETAWRVAVEGGVLSSTRTTSDDKADVVIEATGHELLALLLRRHDIPAAQDFLSTFPAT